MLVPAEIIVIVLMILKEIIGKTKHMQEKAKRRRKNREFSSMPRKFFVRLLENMLLMRQDLFVNRQL
jgi:hypothetical protein